MQTERLPAAIWNSDHGPFDGSHIASRDSFFGTTIGMKDEVVDRAALDDEMSVVGCQPMQVATSVARRPNTQLRRLE